MRPTFTVEAARLGGRASAALIDEETCRERAQVSRRWWSKFTPAERSRIVRQRLQRFPGRPRKWTLDVPADHSGVLAMRANGMRMIEPLAAAKRAGRILRMHQAQDLRAQGFSHRDIAARMGLRLDTVQSYFTD
jgi:hypothetical protein